MSLLAQNIFHIFLCVLVYTKIHHAKLYQMPWTNLEKLPSLLMTDLHQMLCKCHELLKWVDVHMNHQDHKCFCNWASKYVLLLVSVTVTVAGIVNRFYLVTVTVNTVLKLWLYLNIYMLFYFEIKNKYMVVLIRRGFNLRWAF